MNELHKVIRIIVYAETRDEAFSKATEVLDRLCGEEKTFDYYSTFDKKESTVSGIARWGTIGTGCEEITKEVVKKLLAEKEFKKQLSGKKWAAAGSALAYELVYGGMMSTLEERRQGLREVRKVLCSCEAEDELLTRKHDMLGYYARMFAGDAMSVYLFDADGEIIADVDHMKDTMQRLGMKVWVVPADVHF